MSGLLIRTYNGNKYLSVPRDGFEVSNIDDIGVVEDIPTETKSEQKFTRVSIMGVRSLEKFDGCYSCSGKVLPQPESSTLGKCTRCGTIQRLDRCQALASARLDLDCGAETKTVVAFSDVLQKICCGDVNLLTCKEFDVVVSEKDVIKYINRVFVNAFL